MQPLNLPQAVVVETDVDGYPKLVGDKELRRSGGAAERRTYEVETVMEVWRVDEEWWREPISRRCVEAVLKGGAHVVLYEDLITGDWFMQKP
jgi:hypothetical protein